MNQQRPVAQDTCSPLAGRHIVVTRPAAQAGQFAAAIERLGAHAVLFPVLAIKDLGNPQALLDVSARLEDYDLAVFVSPNAVDKALGVICAQRAWPQRLRVAVMGKASAHAVARFGIGDVIAPTLQHDSEALLALPELQSMAGRRVLIFRGDGGRDLLAETLTQRGAIVEFVTCYARSKPDCDAGPLLQLWAQKQLDAFTITSSEGLRNLVEMLGEGGQVVLRNTPLFASHARIVEAARSNGVQCTVATEPGDEGLLAGMIEYFSSPEYESRKHLTTSGIEPS